jgi:ABC-type sulfate transport system substrate-binding protein
LTIKPEGQFVHPNGIGYKHLAIATYESFLPQLEQEFTKQGKVMEVIYPSVIILNNFPAVRITTEGKNGKATQAFMDYLLGADAQTALLQFGFRPANPKIDYSSYPVSKYFRNDIEIGDAPATQQLLRDLWDIVSNMPGVQTVKF